eukprot:GSMAST32.ASY1.ANO1.1854.1 assembled CDS
MKLNIANPAIGSQKLLEIDEEKKLRVFYDTRMGQEVAGEDVSEEFAGYIFKVTGGNDKQGFPMMQGVLTQNRTRERKRKSVRGCIVASDIAPMRLGPKRASKIRKLFNLSKKDDTVTKAPKIQRLVTPLTLQRKRRRLAHKKAARSVALKEAAAYARLIAQRKKEHRASVAARRSSRRRSRMSKVA